ncbi:ATP-binding protein [Streptomyces albiflaviniger]|nr:ATP-binding protein [Streptomyces albiflaviniger]
MSQAMWTVIRSDVTPSDARERGFPLPCIPEAIGSVRRHASMVLTDWNVPPDTADDALLVISELATNAITYALAPAILRLAWTKVGSERFLRIEVTDAGPAPHTQPSEPEEHGRGTLIVAALSTRHGLRAHPGGITRWADLVPPEHHGCQAAA